MGKGSISDQSSSSTFRVRLIGVPGEVSKKLEERKAPEIVAGEDDPVLQCGGPAPHPCRLRTPKTAEYHQEPSQRDLFHEANTGTIHYQNPRTNPYLMDSPCLIHLISDKSFSLEGSDRCECADLPGILSQFFLFTKL